MAQLLENKGNKDYAEELKENVKTLEEIEKCPSKEDFKKKGFLRRLQRIAEDLGDENSRLHKTVKGIKEGANIAKDLVNCIGKITQLLG